MKKLTALTPLLIFLSLVGCELTDHTDDDTENNGFETAEVADVFSKNCATSGCHAGSNPPDGLSLESHSDLLAGSFDRPVTGSSNYGGEVVIPYRPDKSLLYQVVSNNLSSEMSVDHSILSSTELQTLSDWIEDGAKNSTGNVPFTTPESYRIFVCNQSSDVVSVIDGTNDVVSRIGNVDITDNFNDKPHMVKEFGDYYYVTLIASGRFLKIRKSDNQIVAQLAGLEYPGMIQIMDSGTRVYVSRSSTAPGIYSSVYFIDIVNMVLLKEIDLVVQGLPHGIVLSPDNAKLYVANLTSNVIHIINTSINEVSSLINFSEDHQPMQTAISPDGLYLYVSARGTSRLLVIETQTAQIEFQVPLNSNPMQLSVSPDGSKIYVSSMGGDVVEVVTKSGFSWSKTNEISHPAFNLLHGSDLTADGRYLYVSSRNTDGAFVPPYLVKEEGIPGSVGVIDTQTESVIKVIEIEEFGSGLVVEK